MNELPSAAWPPILGPLKTRGARIEDAHGRRVMLRGANLSGRHKMPPFLSIERASELDRWASLGWNLMRLVIPWESIEPSRGAIDRAQIERLAELASWAGERGIHVIADFHQDLYARALGGSGAPEWSILPADRPSEPIAPDRFWFLRYATSEAVRRSLARFWRNDDGIQDNFVACAEALSARLSKVPAVIGIEPWNEPFPGDLDFDGFENRFIAPLVRRVAAAARAHAPRWLVFVEGTVLASEAGTALDVSDLEGVVYFPHFYDKVAMSAQQWMGETKEMDRAFATFDRDAARMNVPWMLGEYGCAIDTSNKVDLMEKHQRALLSRGAGGTAWNYDTGALDWNDERMGLDDELLRALSHPYPTAIYGELVSATLEKDFSLEWESAGSGAPTEISCPDDWSSAAIESSAPYVVRDRRVLVTAPAGRARLAISGAR